MIRQCKNKIYLVLFHLRLCDDSVNAERSAKPEAYKTNEFTILSKISLIEAYHCPVYYIIF